MKANKKEQYEKFLLMLYFKMYKDFPSASTMEFRRYFKSKHGDFKYLDELIVMINKYQVEHYEQTLVF